MAFIKFLLFPISIIYSSITFLRNKLYDTGFFKSYTPLKKSITVGNLSMGGTGKTPHVGYLIEHFLNSNKNVATLSRGYGRKTKGVLDVQSSSTSKDVGDEPLLYKLRYESIDVVVCESRVFGAKHIQTNHPKAEIILLDDAFQHRKLKAGLNVLITEFEHPFINDFVVPSGRLREGRNGAKRSDVIIISKTPEFYQQHKKDKLRSKVEKYCSNVFFSRIIYKDFLPFQPIAKSSYSKILLVTGIGNPKPLFQNLNLKYDITHLKFDDHYEYTDQDITEIHKKFDSFVDTETIILTTEKDYMRLQTNNVIKNSNYPWFYIPISIEIEDSEGFLKIINNYVNSI